MATWRHWRPTSQPAAILLNHRDWQTAATAIAFYHHPDESDASLAILSGSGYSAPRERDELHRLFGVPEP